MEHTGHRRFGGVYWKACPHSSATWDKTYDWPDKKIIAVIGDGSSGIQVGPALQPKAARIVNYVCHPTWVSVNLSPNITKDRMRANLSIARKRKRSSEMIPKHSWSTGNGLTAHLIDKLIPKFEIGCRRLSLGDGYLEALQQSNAKWCFEGIEEITKTSIRTAAGEEECDLNVCATGFDTTFVPGWEGRRLDVEWEKVSRGTWQRTQDDQLNC
ncbi:unnamed protein product [Penicillium crustosum]